ncbi:MAG: superoxide dismutase [Gemmatimonadota bacterium]|nr:MAG: superoxide dismutase [Gemmatimonadota bacterium]
MAHALPPLPYDYKALEPHIDEQTMRLHHDIHHKGYVDGLNAAEAKLAAMRDSSDFAAVQAVQRALAFHGSGHFNHVIFWENMGPNGGGTPAGDLGSQIQKDFGSFDKFRAHFSAAAATVEGNGWGMLGWNPMAGHLMVLASMNHQNQGVHGTIPILMLDVWEHAYYLKYQNKRPAYVEAWWNVVNWENVAERFDAATSLRAQST